MVNLTICTNHPRSRFQSLTCQNGLKFVIHPIQATGIRQQTILLEQMFMEIPSKMMLHGLSSLTIYSTRKCCFLMETNQHGWLWPKQQQLERITQMPREISWHLPSVENHLQPECITEEMSIQKILGSVLKIMQLVKWEALATACSMEKMIHGVIPKVKMHMEELMFTSSRPTDKVTHY